MQDNGKTVARFARVANYNRITNHFPRLHVEAVGGVIRGCHQLPIP